MPYRLATWWICSVLTSGLFVASAPSISWAQGPKKAPASKSTATARSKRVADPGSPNLVADYKSRNFVIKTDLPADEAKELLKRLESMLGIVEKYFGQKLHSTIGMIVARDLDAWPPELVRRFDRAGIESIQSGGGVTLSQTLSEGGTGRVLDAKAIVYAVADRGTPQHEAVHAYCVLTFGRTGPTWYSEGMAEIGQYWSEKGLGVHCHDVVLEYLKSESPRPLLEIVDTSAQSGDSWQNYAWRWVLCHMLSYNPNYATRFKPLGLGLLNGQDVSFEGVYGPMAKEIEFEYQFFLKHIDQGYRADLCAWDWKAKSPPCRGSSAFNSKVEAQRGWQPARLTVEADTEYDYAAAGTWKLSADAEPVDANGDAAGRGRLMGVIFDNYTLSDPFELGAYGTFTPPSSGQLFVRCQDDWHRLADNSGKLSLKIKLTGKGPPLPDPTQSTTATTPKPSGTKAASSKSTTKPTPKASGSSE